MVAPGSVLPPNTIVPSGQVSIPIKYSLRSGLETLLNTLETLKTKNVKISLNIEMN